jgi:hypothetical protein
MRYGALWRPLMPTPFNHLVQQPTESKWPGRGHSTRWSDRALAGPVTGPRITAGPGVHECGPAMIVADGTSQFKPPVPARLAPRRASRSHHRGMRQSPLSLVPRHAQHSNPRLDKLLRVLMRWCSFRGLLSS